MKRHFYGEHDYHFGQLMVALRMRTGFTQVALGKLLNLSRRAIAQWENGNSYPSIHHLQRFIEVCVQHQV
jgi:transcriptional regulator with XRE-family HTH domain